MEDKMIELARFTLVSEAEILANLLKSEGVDCYVRDCFINQIYNGIDLGGVKIELLEKDLQRAREIMKAYGYGNAEEIEQAGEIEENGETEEIAEIEENVLAEYEQNKTKLTKTMTILSILILILVGILIFLNKYFNG